MRTTIVLDDTLSRKLKDLASQKGLSEFINQCIFEHFEREEKLRRMKELEKSYARAAKAGDDLSVLETEDWPEW
jgi:predicted transcriptional regulator